MVPDTSCPCGLLRWCGPGEFLLVRFRAVSMRLGCRGRRQIVAAVLPWENGVIRRPHRQSEMSQAEAYYLLGQPSECER